MSGINWEKSKSLTPLKHDLLKALFRYRKDFFLTGGSALGIFYLDHRRSYDLDFFSTEDIDWHKLSNDIAGICKEIGAHFEQNNASPTFRRYSVTRGDEKEIVDFVRELVPQVYAKKNEFNDIQVDTLEEIAINKWCTLLGRTEIKDIVDLYFLSSRIDIWQLFEKAKEKEGGVDPAMFSYLMSQISINEIPDYLLLPLPIEQLTSFVNKLRSFFDEKSFPEV